MRVTAVFALVGLLLAPLSPAQASSSRTGKGNSGQSISVSAVTKLNAKGTTLRVTGRNFDEAVGIYVALCVIPKKGSKPGPCGGGADMTGAAGASAWVSSHAPAYGKGLAIPYRPGGDFNVRITVSSRIGSLDCRKVKCAVVTRADHLRPEDRSADVIVPVSFSK